MAQTTKADRVKRFFGIDPEDKLNDGQLFDDGSFIEDEVSTRDYLRSLIPTKTSTQNYFKELFPFLGWIFHYNLTWALGDFIAGESSHEMRRVGADIRRCDRRLRRRTAGHGICASCPATP